MMMHYYSMFSSFMVMTCFSSCGHKASKIATVFYLWILYRQHWKILVFVLLFELRGVKCVLSGPDLTFAHTSLVATSINFECNRTLNENSKWFFNGNVIYLNKLLLDERFGDTLALSKDNCLLIKNVSLEHEGLYQCMRESIIVANHFLTVEVRPEVTLTINEKSTSGVVKVKPNETLLFKCKATGSKPMTDLSWIVNENISESRSFHSTKVTVNSQNNITFDTSMKLSFQPKAPEGNVTCVAKMPGLIRYYHASYKVDKDITEEGSISTEEGFISVILTVTISFGILLILCAVLWCTKTYNSTLNVNCATPSVSENIGHHKTVTESNHQHLLREDLILKTHCKKETGEIGVDKHRLGESDIEIVEYLRGDGLINYWAARTSKHERKPTLIGKSLSENAKLEDVMKFRDFAGTLITLPENSNLVRTIHITTTVPYYIFQEHIGTGTLHEFLQTQTNLIEDPNQKRYSTETEGINRKLSRFVLDIGSAMAFLAKRQIYHPALSARDVLLDNFLRCKLHDLWPAGLALKKIQNIMHKPNPPVAWIAPEATLVLQYSEKLDAWSFGTVIWEIFSFGETPYKNKTTDDIVQEISSNRTLAQPDACPRSMYQLILMLWVRYPDKRPSFDEICTVLQSSYKGNNETPIYALTSKHL
ncbi:Megakaryocyte-associated tyrosine-protein kinase [Holothuria leucospilota]|uniref:Megakaryocyte-associated tyrosine-protein kinase n=1 Tax=Holothuria leucospilota TaxID=206669 RepID=A0A9Q1CQ16_HOLLE|nr:Megakaryocyte-associated tyrosine-protein kinase [Holothuria leucospilota]